MLIKLHKRNGDVFYLNADKILTVSPFWSYPPSSPDDPDPSGEVTGSVIYHEPYNVENVMDWENVQETPDQVVELTLPSVVAGKFGE